MKENNRDFYKLLLTLAVFSILGYLALMRLDHYFYLKAIDDCGKMASVSWNTPDGTSTFTEPHKEPYQECLKLKGVPVPTITP